MGGGDGWVLWAEVVSSIKKLKIVFQIPNYP